MEDGEPIDIVKIDWHFHIKFRTIIFRVVHGIVNPTNLHWTVAMKSYRYLITLNYPTKVRCTICVVPPKLGSHRFTHLNFMF